MKVLNTLLLIIIFDSNINAQTVVSVRDSMNKEPLIGASIYSFKQDSCFDHSDFDGIISLANLEKSDTLFQVEYVGYLFKSFSLQTNNDTVIIDLLDLGNLYLIYGTDGAMVRSANYFDLVRTKSKCR